MITEYYYLLLTLLGACIGSLLNVVTFRLPLMIDAASTAKFNLWLPGSHCPQCKTAVRWYDNIPLLSWCILKGRCRQCHHPISYRYPLTELTSILLTLACGGLFLPGPFLLALLLFSWLLLALVTIDAGHHLLPDTLTLPLLWLGLLVNMLGWLSPLTLAAGVSGTMVGYAGLALLSRGYRLLSGKEALGMGDAKLLAALGAWLGWQPIPLLLLIASMSGIGWLLMARLLLQRPLNAPLAFGPFLAVAGWLLLVLAYR